MRHLLLSLFLVIPTIVLAQKTYHVSSPGASLHEMPRENSKAMAYLKRGDELQYIKTMESGEWAKVKFGSDLGYVMTRHLSEGSFEKTIRKAESKKYHVSVFQTVVYDQPSFKGKRLRTLQKNDLIEIIGEADEWGKVKSSAGIGYIYMAHLEVGKPVKEDKPVVESETYVVEFPQVEIRKEANPSAAVLEKKSKGAYIEVQEIVNGNWGKVRMSKGFGYVNLRGLKKPGAGGAATGGGGNGKNQGKAKYPRKFGAVCRDGTVEYRTGPKTCTEHNGVKMWIYKAPR